MGSKDTITCAYLMQGTVNEMMETKGGGRRTGKESNEGRTRNERSFPRGEDVRVWADVGNIDDYRVLLLSVLPINLPFNNLLSIFPR